MPADRKTATWYTVSMSEIRYEWAQSKESLEVIANDAAYEWEHNPEYFSELLHFKRALVAYVGEQPVGYLLFQVIWGNTPFLSQVWIHASMQEKGIGRTMVSMLEERLKTEGYNSLTTSNETKNTGAIQFVEKLGFEEIGTLQMGHGPEVFSIKKL